SEVQDVISATVIRDPSAYLFMFKNFIVKNLDLDYRVKFRLKPMLLELGNCACSRPRVVLPLPNAVSGSICGAFEYSSARFLPITDTVTLLNGVFPSRVFGRE